MPEHCSAPPFTRSLSLESPTLDTTHLSHGTLHILTTNTPLSPSLDRHLPFSSFFTATSAGIHTSVAPNPYLPVHSPSGCFETPTIKFKSAKSIPLEGSPDPLTEHPFAPRSGKKKSKCVKTTSKDITIGFGETSAIGEEAFMASTILVGHVHGRAYSAKRITLWVKEIWGGLFKELPKVQVLLRGWFALDFTKENYTDFVLARYFHIEMAPVLLKRWSLFLILSENKLVPDPYGCACQGSLYSIGARSSSSESGMPLVHIWTMTEPL